MAVLTGDGALHVLPEGRRVGGGPCAVVQRRSGGQSVIHGTCILQRVASEPTALDLGAQYRLVLADGRSLEVRILKRSLTTCGPEVVRFEGPGALD